MPTLGMGVTLANSALDLVGAASVSGYATPYVQGHTGHPEDGTANVSAVGSREALTFAAPSGGSVSTSATATFATVSLGSTETWTHFTVWTSSSGGSLLASGAWDDPFDVSDGDSIAVTDIELSIDDIAAS